MTRRAGAFRQAPVCSEGAEPVCLLRVVRPFAAKGAQDDMCHMITRILVEEDPGYGICVRNASKSNRRSSYVTARSRLRSPPHTV